MLRGFGAVILRPAHLQFTHQLIELAIVIRFSLRLYAEIVLHHPLHGWPILPALGKIGHVLPSQAFEDVVGEPSGGGMDESDEIGSAGWLTGSAATAKGAAAYPLICSMPVITGLSIGRSTISLN